jgi:flagellar hook-associated protein 2
MVSSIQFSGVGSGLPVKDWINTLMALEEKTIESIQRRKTAANTSKTTINTVASKFSSLRNSIRTITDANLAVSFDLFKRKKVSSSDDTIAGATVSSNAVSQQVELEITSLATSTKAQSKDEAGKIIDGTEKFTDLLNGEATEGTFTIYTDGISHEFKIGENDTVNNIINTINNAGITGLQASVSDGRFQLKIDNANITALTIGSNADTSNFVNVMGLSTATAENIIEDPPYDKVYKSTIDVSKVNTAGKIIGNEANLNGTFNDPTYKFKIGGTEFTIDSNTTLESLISKINSDDSAGVIAQYDLRTNKIMLTSKEAGKTAINIQDTTGNFLEQMGFITAGNSLSSQTLGTNAIVTINSRSLEVNSNTVTSDMSGISGLTINLKNKTATGEKVTLNIEKDTEDLTDAVQDFVDKFNAAVNEVDKQTANGASLDNEYSLVSIRNSIKLLVSDRVSGLSDYDSLGMIGITTGQVGSSVEANTKTLKFNKDKLLEALQNNPEEVRTLFIGDKTKGITGVLETLSDKMETVLDPVNGYFEARKDSINSQIIDFDKSIARTQDRIDTKREILTKQFQMMDQYISQMQQSSATIARL